MAWTYDETDLNTSTASGRLNAVRLLVGDNDRDDEQVQDEEIAFALSLSANSIYYAASWIAKTLAGKYSRLVDTELDGQLSEKYSQLQAHYKSLSVDLDFQAQKSAGGLGVAAGGISRSEMEVHTENTDRVQPRITRDKFRYLDRDYVSDYWE